MFISLCHAALLMVIKGKGFFLLEVFSFLFSTFSDFGLGDDALPPANVEVL